MEEKKFKELKNYMERYKTGYTDPDGINFNYTTKKYYYSNENYYREYAKVLDYKSEMFDVSFDESYEKPGLIFKSKASGKTYYLKSDQFGFSRIGGNYKGELVYPYEIYLKKVLEIDEESLPEAKKKVEKWLEITRQVGGSFFWPMEEKKPSIFDLNPEYNRKRGNVSYIEDRVDVTLFEIYEIYNSSLLKEYRELKRNILVKSCGTVTLEWLSEFNSFEEYVEFFAFEPFVEEKNINGEIKYVPYNLLDSELKEFSFGNQPRTRVLYKLSKEESSKERIEQYEYLFKNVANRVENRNKLLINFANKK